VGEFLFQRRRRGASLARIIMEAGMDLTSLGWNETLQRALLELGEPALEPARVAIEHRKSYEVLSASGPRWVELGGRLRHQSQSRLELPAVGDWVGLRDGRIEGVLPRHSVFVRQGEREHADIQIIAANLDVVFIVTSANADFNPRRIERYLAAVAESGATAVLVLNKTDLCEDPEPWLARLGPTRVGLPIACVSALTQRGKEELLRHVGPTSSVALVGMSGTGKSTIANWLLGREALTTGAIRAHDDRGQHTTSHRELFALPGGGALIDTPGMRELGLVVAPQDLEAGFPEIARLASECRFGDCQHQKEPGCAIAAAVLAGELTAEHVAHYHQLKQELSQRQAKLSVSANRRQRPSAPGSGKGPKRGR
jgi:ribosome biogenesis GTPase / thiamine phosphate phosphatase